MAITWIARYGVFAKKVKYFIIINDSEEMVLIRLIGGLGNQMFQYATGRALSKYFDLPLMLDLSYLNSEQKGNTKRSYELKYFKINAKIYESKTLFRIYRRIISQHVFLSKLLPLSILTIDENNWENAITKLDNYKIIYLNGYWQSEEYFKNIRKILLCEFVPKNAVEWKNEELADEIASVNSVAIHIRRGDYISNPETNKFHGTCNIDYYGQGMRTIECKIDKPNYFIFSDDIQWCKNNLHSKYPITFVDNNNDETAFEDLRLMSLCKHNIIANSSFSWWGAWLNVNPDKIVIAPEKWFNDDSKNTKDIIPDNWLKI